MPTTLEYALFSANVYGDSNAVRKPQNVLPVPDGWTPLPIAPNNVLSSGSTSTGFMASAYQNGNDIVIAYAGTTDEDTLDWLNGNVPAATAASLAPQVLDAARFYLEVLAAHPGANITFTGHSLGGGLASLMAVYFSKHATVFDEAPFQKSADSSFVLDELKTSLTTLGYALPVELSSYVALDPSGALIASPSRVMRQGDVDQIYTAGEALSLVGTAMTNYLAGVLGLINPELWILGTGVAKITGSVTMLDPKAHTMLDWGNDSLLPYVSGNPTDLHSISLLTGFLESPQFLGAVQGHPELLPRLFAGLYQNSPKVGTANLLDLLVQREYRGEQSLDALSVDVNKIDLKDGLTSVTQFANAAAAPIKINVASVLDDAVFASLYNQGKSRLPGQPNSGQFQTELRQVTGGLQIDTTTLDPNKVDALERELQQVLNALLGGRDGAVPVRPDSRWTLQSGAGGLQLNQDSDNRSDIVLGYVTDDLISTGGGDDVIVAGDGADTLVGGAGADTLYGGKGIDTYRFAKGSGSDTIVDSDGQGVINIDIVGIGALDGSGATKLADGSWQSADKKVKYALMATDATHNDLVITFGDVGDRPDIITIKNWSQDKNLGISQLAQAATPPTVAGTLTGDIDKATAGTSYLTNANGYQSSGDAAGAADVINGSSGDDHISGLGGNDGLSGGDGADFIEGGDGDDLILGGFGADTLNGGDGNDYIFGSAVGSIDRPGSVDFVPPASSGTELARGFSWVVYNPDAASGKDVVMVGGADIFPGIPAPGGGSYVENTGNVIDGGAGNDFIASGTGADVAHGGDGNDSIVGMDGADILFGDAGDDKLWGDGTQDATDADFTPLDAYGNDILSGGDGNDQLVGQGGDDTLYGGAGKDVLYGDDDHLANTPVSIQGRDYLDGGDGDDSLFGGARGDTLFGGAGNDHLWGDAGAVSKTASDYLQPQDQGDDYLDGEEGDDYLQGEGGNDTLYGGTGNDTLQGDATQDRLPGSAQGKDYLDGEDGDDSLLGGGSDDTLYGGSGNDVLQGDDFITNLDAAFDGNDYLDGEDGNDTLVGQGGRDTLFGGAGDDRLEGDFTDTPVAFQGDDYLDGEDGNDVLLGEGGNDTLVGGDGNDSLSGGSGDDTLLGGAGDDALVGDDGNDVLDGGAGNNVLAGGAGDDTYIVDLSSGTNNIIDTEGNDTVEISGTGDGSYSIGQAAGDTQSLIILSGGGAVRLEGALIGQGPRNIVLDGTHEPVQQLLANATASLTVDARSHSGAATLLGGGANDVLLGGAAGSQFDAGAGNDQLIGLGGADTYVFGLGDGHDTIIESGGVDRVSFSQGLRLEDLHAVAIANSNDLRLEFAGGDSVTIAAGQLGVIERFTFADGNSLGFAQLMQAIATPGQLDLAGTMADDTLYGGSSNDTLSGYGADDVLQGGTGDDLLQGGAGNDTYVLDEGDGQDLIVDSQGQGNVIRFGDGIAIGSLAATVEVDSNGNDQLVISYGSRGDTVRVPGGTNAVIAELQFSDGSSIGFADWLSLAKVSAQASAADNRIIGSDNGDLLDGLAGNDYIDGGAGNDTLLGGVGSDSLIGGDGDDVLDGGTGNDFLQGGAGEDTYVLDTDSGHDTVIDPSASGRVRLGTGVDPSQISLVRAGQDLLVSVGGPGGSSLTLRDFFASGAAWTMTSAQGTSFDIRGLYVEQAHARAQGSDEAQALFAQEAFAAKLRALQQSSIDWWMTRAPFVPDTDGNLIATAPAVGNPYETDNYRIVSTTETIASDDAVIEFDEPWEMTGTTVITGQIVTTTTETVTDTVNLPARIVRSLSVEEFTSMFANGAYDSTEYQPLFGSGQSQGVIIGYLQMAPGGTQQVTRQVTHTTTQNLMTSDTTVNQSIVQLVAGGSDNDIYIGSSHALVDAGAGNDTIKAAGDAPFGDFDTEYLGASRQGPGSFLYGNAGDDLIQGGWADDELVGGLGNDSMDGAAGNDTYHVFAESEGWDTVLDAGAPIVEVRAYEGNESVERVAQLYAQLGKQGQLFLDRDVAIALQAGNQGYDAYLSYDFALNVYVNAFGGNAAAIPLADDFAGLEPLYASGLLNTDTIAFDGGIQLSDLHFAYGTNTVDGVQRRTLDISWGADSGVHVVLPNADDPVGFGVERFAFGDGGTTLTMTQMLALANAQIGPLPGDVSQAHTIVFEAGVGRVNLHFAFSADTTAGVQRQALDISWGTDHSVHVVLPNADDAAGFGITQFAFADGATLTTAQMIALANAQLHPAPVIGTSFDDYLVGSDYSADTLLGGGGNDTLVGGGGDDLLDAGTGTRQLLDGGSGDDTLIVDMSSNQGHIYDTVVDDSGSNTLRLKGLNANDVHVVMTDINGPLQMQIATNDFNRVINVSDSGQAIQSFIFDDATLTLAQMMGRLGWQSIHGGDGNERIFGGSQGDFLYGGGGDDTITGGSGNDYLFGDTGHDTFVFAPGSGADVVFDSDGSAEFVFHGITPDQLQVERLDAEMLLSVSGTTDHVLIPDWFDGPDSDYSVRFDDGTVWDTSMVESFLPEGQRTRTADGTEGDDTLLGGTGDDFYETRGGNDVVSDRGGDDEVRFWSMGGARPLTIKRDGSNVVLSNRDGSSVEVLGGATAQGLIEKVSFIFDGTYSEFALDGDTLVEKDFDFGGTLTQEVHIRADGSQYGTEYNDGQASDFTDDGSHRHEETRDSSGTLVSTDDTWYDGQGNSREEWRAVDGSYENYDQFVDGSSTDDWYDAQSGQLGNEVVTADRTDHYWYTEPTADGAVEALDNYWYADGTSITSDTVTHPDGSFVRQVTNRDGSFKNEAFDAATGEDSGSWREPGNNYTKDWDDKPLAGGADQYDQTLTYDDGSTYTSHKVTQADSSWAIDWNSSDGSSGIDTLDATGTVYTHSWRRADGTSGTDNGNTGTGETSGSRASPSGDSSTYEILHLANGAVEEKDTTAAADGNAASYDTITQADGSFVKHETFSDGSFKNETFDAATSEDSGTWREPGNNYVKAWGDKPLAGGLDQYDQTLTYDDGSIFASHKVTQADGSWATDWSNSDGSSGTDTLDASGTVYTHAWRRADGVSGTDNGNTVTGETSGSRVLPSGDSSTYDILHLAGGAVEEKDTTAAADGSTASYDTVTQADGSFVKHETFSDGSFKNETFDAATGEDSGTWREPGNNYVKAWDDKPLAAGAVEYDQTVSYDDGSVHTSNKLVQADGSYSNAWTDSDGSHGIDFVGATAGAGDTFAWGLGGGASTLQTSSGNDSLQLGSGIAADDLWFRQDGSDLDISVMGSTDKLDIEGWFNGSLNQVQSIMLSDGERLLQADVQKLVNAMATFAPPDSSQLEYTADERTAIAPVIAANWH